MFGRALLMSGALAMGCWSLYVTIKLAAHIGAWPF